MLNDAWLLGVFASGPMAIPLPHPVIHQNGFSSLSSSFKPVCVMIAWLSAVCDEYVLIANTGQLLCQEFQHTHQLLLKQHESVCMCGNAGSSSAQSEVHSSGGHTV